jgi:hypothetical protein
MSDKDSISGVHTAAERREENSRRQESRRVSIEASSDVDNRKKSDRRGDDRRGGPDRRGFFQNLYNPDDNFLYDVFMWLIDNIEGEWTAGPNENEIPDSKVTCRIRFDNKKDLDAFIIWLRKWEESKGS